MTSGKKSEQIMNASCTSHQLMTSGHSVKFFYNVPVSSHIPSWPEPRKDFRLLCSPGRSECAQSSRGRPTLVCRLQVSVAYHSRPRRTLHRPGTSVARRPRGRNMPARHLQQRACEGVASESTEGGKCKESIHARSYLDDVVT